MNRNLAGDGWQARAVALATHLEATGVLSDNAWLKAFAETPRHVFAPRIIQGTHVITGERAIERSYTDDALLTRTILDASNPTRQELPASSSSQPSIMAVMLEAAELRPGHRVLEIGTGTGYNAALLCHRLGDHNVFSVDIDTQLVEAARWQLAALDRHPTLDAHNGDKGWDEHAPFDRIIATCSIRHISPDWIRQLSTDGRLVAPLDSGAAGRLVVLDKSASDEVSGWILGHPAGFMPLRNSANDPLGPGQTTGFSDARIPHYGTTELDPTSIAHAPAELLFFLWLHLPGMRLAGEESTVIHTSSALAEAHRAPLTDGSWPVQQRGTGRLWDTVEHAAASWHKLSRPGFNRYGVTALDDIHRQYVWLDDPDGTHSWPLV